MKWVKDSVQELAELLPDSVKVKKGDGDVGAADLKDSALTTKLHLACKLTPQFVKTMQKHYQTEKRWQGGDLWGETHLQHPLPQDEHVA